MTAVRRILVPFVLCALVAVAACSKQGSQTTAASPAPVASAAPNGSPEPSSTSAADAQGGASPASSAGATPTDIPTSSPVPNLLTPQSGTILRAYPPADQNAADVAASGLAVDDKAAGPWTFVFELPGVATIARLTAQVPTKADTVGSTMTFAVSTTSATAGFSDVGTIASSGASDDQSIALNSVRARWVRVTTNRTGGGSNTIFSSVGAYGTIATPATLSPGGTYVQYDKPYADGGFATAPSDADPWYLQVVTFGKTGINGQQCFDGKADETYPGTLDGRTWTWKRSESSGTFTVNDEGSILTGSNGSFWVRTDKRPKHCVPRVVGAGGTNVIVLESKSESSLYPTSSDDEAKSMPGYRFSHIGAGMVDATMLAGASTVILNGLCDADDMLAPAQGQAIVDWVAAGHKLLIYDADMCGKGTHYGLLPYPFTSDNPGAKGAKGDRLIQVEDDSLGTSDKTDKARYFDPLVYANNDNQLGDANTVTTHDPHWCGHLFGTNANNVNGFMQMYALHGRGLIVFDGFDHDDGAVPSYQFLRKLEIAQSVPPDLPCTQKASLAFIIQPNRDGTFVPGKTVTLPFAMELLANQGWKGHVNVTTSGDFKAEVTPNSFDVNGSTQALKIAVNIPADAKPGQYAIIVNGDGGSGQTAQATISLKASVPLVKQIRQQRRIRIYGIHFDVDKATIKPQSEPVIKQIADVMKQNPSFRFRVEGHTDSDGGEAHNRTLSQHRAESVVNDLISRYHIAKSRLVPQGFGYSKPVAPNTTAAGKALNRRVELFLLSGG